MYRHMLHTDLQTCCGICAAHHLADAEIGGEPCRWNGAQLRTSSRRQAGGGFCSMGWCARKAQSQQHGSAAANGSPSADAVLHSWLRICAAAR